MLRFLSLQAFALRPRWIQVRHPSSTVPLLIVAYSEQAGSRFSVRNHLLVADDVFLDASHGGLDFCCALSLFVVNMRYLQVVVLPSLKYLYAAVRQAVYARDQCCGSVKRNLSRVHSAVRKSLPVRRHLRSVTFFRVYSMSA